MFINTKNYLHLLSGNIGGCYKKLVELKDPRTKDLLIFHYYKIQDSNHKFLKNTTGFSNFDYRELKLILDNLDADGKEYESLIFQKELFSIHSNCANYVCENALDKLNLSPNFVIEKSIQILKNPEKKLYFDSAVENIANFINFDFDIKGSTVCELFASRKRVSYAGNKHLNTKYLKLIIINYDSKVPRILFNQFHENNDWHDAISILQKLIIISSKELPIFITSKRFEKITNLLILGGSLNVHCLKLLTLLIIFKSHKKSLKTITNLIKDNKVKSHNKAYIFHELNIINSISPLSSEIFELYKNTIDTGDQLLKARIIEGLQYFENEEAKLLFNNYKDSLIGNYTIELKSSFEETSIESIRNDVFNMLDANYTQRSIRKHSIFDTFLYKLLDIY